jgi:drug/metabolite transporter (DMT)-like permease
MQWLGIFTVIAGLVTVGLVSTLSSDQSGSSKSSTGQQVLGVILIISAMVFTGLHVRKRKESKNK